MFFGMMLARILFIHCCSFLSLNLAFISCIRIKKAVFVQALLSFIRLDWFPGFMSYHEILKWSFVLLAGGGIGSCLRIIVHFYPEWLKHSWQKQARDYLMEEGVIAPNRFNLCCDSKEYSTLFRYLQFRYLQFRYLRQKSRRESCCSAGYVFPVIEMLTAVLNVLIVSHFSMPLPTLALCYLLIILLFIDLNKQLLPDIFTFSLLWLGLLVNVTEYFVPIEQAIIGAVCGYLSLWLVYWGAKLVWNKECIGYGDFKLLAGLGAWFGWEVLPNIVLLACISALLVVLSRWLYQRTRTVLKESIAFGSYLSLAGIVMLFK